MREILRKNITKSEEVFHVDNANSQEIDKRALSNESLS